MALRPLRDKVVVKPSEGEEKSSGGIFLPDTAKKKPQEGKVIAVGSGRLLEDGTVRELAVKVGDTVVYSKYGGTEVKLDGEDYVLLDEDQIYALVVNE
jgi:chaperonin GroES